MDITQTKNSPETQTQIREKLEAQKQYLSTLEKVCMSLDERLIPASRQEPQDSLSKEEAESLVPIAEELRANNNFIHRITLNITGMIDRLEL